MKKQNEDTTQNKIIVFESKRIRRIWHNDEWYFPLVDVCGALTDQIDNLKARKYWNKLAQRLRSEGSELVTICHQLKLEASDGKKCLKDSANIEMFKMDAVEKVRIIENKQ